MEVTNKVIYKTKNYSIFKYLNCNRKIGSIRVKNLIESIKKENYLHLENITVNEDFEVLDGQHRLEAAKILDTEIYYTIIKEDKDSEIIPLLNANQSPWILKDFLNFWVNNGKAEYIRLEEFMKKNKFNITQGLIWAKDGSQFTRNQFKKGNFKFNYDETSEKALIYSKHYIEFLKKTNFRPIKIFNSSHFHKALKIFFSSELVNSDHFLTKAIEIPLTIRFSPCEKDYVIQLIDIYNYKLKFNRIGIKTPTTHIKIVLLDKE